MENNAWIDGLFSHSYAEAREKFLSAAARRGLPVESHELELAGALRLALAYPELFGDMWAHRWVGLQPLERCDKADADGDGLVDCADPDCWWSCTPTCPPLSSCP